LEYIAEGHFGLITISCIGDIKALKNLQNITGKGIHIPKNNGRSNTQDQSEGCSCVISAFPPESSEPSHTRSTVIRLSTTSNTRSHTSPASALSLPLLQSPPRCTTSADAITPARRTVRMTGLTSSSIINIETIFTNRTSVGVILITLDTVGNNRARCTKGPRAGGSIDVVQAIATICATESCIAGKISNTKSILRSGVGRTTDAERRNVISTSNAGQLAISHAKR